MTRVGASTYPEFPASERDDCNDAECAEDDGERRQEPRVDVRRREDKDRQGDSQTDHQPRHCGLYQRLREQRHLSTRSGNGFRTSYFLQVLQVATAVTVYPPHIIMTNDVSHLT